MIDSMVSALRLMFRIIPLAFIVASGLAILEAMWDMKQPYRLAGGMLGWAALFPLSFIIFYTFLRNMYFEPMLSIRTLFKSIIPMFILACAFWFFIGLLFYFSFIFPRYVLLGLSTALESFSWYAGFSGSIYGQYVKIFFTVLLGLCALLLLIAIYFGGVFLATKGSVFILTQGSNGINSEYSRGYSFLLKYRNYSDFDIFDNFDISLIKIRSLIFILFYTLFLSLLALSYYGYLLSENEVTQINMEMLRTFIFWFFFFSTSFLFFHLSIISEWLSENSDDGDE